MRCWSPALPAACRAACRRAMQVEVAQLVQRRLQSLPGRRRGCSHGRDLSAGRAGRGPGGRSAAAARACEPRLRQGCCARSAVAMCAHDLIRDAVLAALPEPGVQAHPPRHAWLAAQEHPAPMPSRHCPPLGAGRRGADLPGLAASRCLAAQARAAALTKRASAGGVAQASLDAAQGLRAAGAGGLRCSTTWPAARPAARAGPVACGGRPERARPPAGGQLCTALVDNRVFAGDIASAASMRRGCASCCPTSGRRRRWSARGADRGWPCASRHPRRLGQPGRGAAPWRPGARRC